MNEEAGISFHYLVPPFTFTNRNKLKGFLNQLFLEEGFQVSTVNFIFCNDSYLLSLNKQHLNHNTYTDIITFQYSPKSTPVVSDIYISVDRVKENALQYSVPFRQELHRVVFHGVLHLCAYSDKTTKEIETMRAKEEFYLDQYFVPREI